MNTLLLLLTALVLSSVGTTHGRAPVELVFVDTLMTATGGLTADRVADVTVSLYGNVYVLMIDGELRQFDRHGLRRSWGGQGRAPGRFVRPTAVATGPHGHVYVFDSEMQAVTVFDSTGTVRFRRVLPAEVRPQHDIAVDAQRRVYVSGYCASAPHAQVHVYCEDLSCKIGSYVPSRSTRDPDVRRHFQGGHLTPTNDGVIFAGLNPYHIAQIDMVRHRAHILARDELLPDAESLAVWYPPDGTPRVTDHYPRTTGVARLMNGQLIYTALLPDQAETVIRILDHGGGVVASGRVPTIVTIEGALSDSTIVVQRQAERQEVALYRIRQRKEEHARTNPLH